MVLFDFFKRDKGKEIFQENADAQQRAEAELETLAEPSAGGLQDVHALQEALAAAQ